MWLVNVGFFSVGQNKLFKELISLQDYCRSCNKQPFQPKPGEACCAQFSGETVACPSISLASVKHSFHFCFRHKKKHQPESAYGSLNSASCQLAFYISTTVFKNPFKALQFLVIVINCVYKMILHM